MVFTRMHLLPRLDGDGETTRLLLEQAFGRIAPIKSAELAISVGKFDSVFGIEYLESQANFRVGITPSLFARYTTGTSVGIKAFYRLPADPDRRRRSASTRRRPTAARSSRRCRARRAA